MLVFLCPSCGSKLQMSEDLAGKKVRCASCQGVITAPMHGEGSDAITAGPGPAMPSTPAAAPTAFAPAEHTRPSRAAAVEPEPIADHRDDRGPRPPRSDGSTAAAAATGIGIGAIAFIVLAVGACLLVPCVLVGLLVPATQKVREAAARMQTINNMKQIVLANINYSDTFRGEMPTPKALVPPQKLQPVDLSWRVSILPFIEEAPLFNRFDQTAAWDTPRNQPLMNPMPRVYEHIPRDEGKKGTTTFFQYFTGPGTLWPDNGKARFPADFLDGTSNTFLFAEGANSVPWSKPADMAIQPGAALPVPPGTFLVAFADGSVRSVDRSKINDQALRFFIDPRDGNPVPPLD